MKTRVFMFKLYLNLGAKQTIITIFDKIRKEIKKMEQPTKILYINFDNIRVLNDEMLKA